MAALDEYLDAIASGATPEQSAEMARKARLEHEGTPVLGTVTIQAAKPTRTCRRITEDERRQIRAHYVANGEITAHTAAAFGRAASSVRKILREGGIEPNKAAQVAGICPHYRAITDDERQRVRDMYASGLNGKSISLKLGRSETTIERLLTELGLFR